jgi:hypothetical protein
MSPVKKIIILYLLVNQLFILKSFAQEQKATTSPADSLVENRPSIKDKDFPMPRLLALEKRGAIKRIRYYAGDEIQFRLKGEAVLYSPIIEQVLDSAIIVNNTLIKFSEIGAVKIYRKRPFLNLMSRFALIGGVGYLAIDLVNNGFRFYDRTLITSAGFVVPGLGISLLLKPRLLKLNQHRYLKTLKGF